MLNAIVLHFTSDITSFSDSIVTTTVLEIAHHISILFLIFQDQVQWFPDSCVTHGTSDTGFMVDATK